MPTVGWGYGGPFVRVGCNLEARVTLSGYLHSAYAIEHISRHVTRALSRITIEIAVSMLQVTENHVEHLATIM